MPGVLGTEVAAGVSTAAVATTFVITAAAAAPAGSLLVICWGSRLNVNGALLTGVTDSRGNTYTVDRSEFNNTSGSIAAIARSVLTTGIQVADTFTLTFSQQVGTPRLFWVEQFSSMAASPFDGAGGNDATATTPPPDASGSVTTTNADDVLIAGFCGLSMSYATISGFTLFTTGAQAVAGPRDAVFGYKIVSSTGTYSTNSNTVQGNGPGVIAAYKAAPAAGPRSKLAVVRRTWAGA